MTNRRERRAGRSARGRLKAIEGGKKVAPNTPAQRLGEDLLAFLGDYLKKHGGLDRNNVMKVLLQLAISIAIDHDVDCEEFTVSAKLAYEEEEQERARRREF